MKKIKLFNRDGANLKLVQKHLKGIDISKLQVDKKHRYTLEFCTEWELQVDKKHKYVLEFCRYIGEFNKTKDGSIEFSNIEAIDPSGGPMISLGDEFEEKYKIVKINGVNNIWISERNNN